MRSGAHLMEPTATAMGEMLRCSRRFEAPGASAALLG